MYSMFTRFTIGGHTVMDSFLTVSSSFIIGTTNMALIYLNVISKFNCFLLPLHLNLTIIGTFYIYIFHYQFIWFSGMIGYKFRFYHYMAFLCFRLHKYSWCQLTTGQCSVTPVLIFYLFVHDHFSRLTVWRDIIMTYHDPETVRSSKLSCIFILCGLIWFTTWPE